MLLDIFRIQPTDRCERLCMASLTIVDEPRMGLARRAGQRSGSRTYDWTAEGDGENSEGWDNAEHAPDDERAGAPSRERPRPLKIIETLPVRQSFRISRRARHSASIVQCNHRVRHSKNQQGQRERYMDQ